jgi:ankyrin repeat protein
VKLLIGNGADINIEDKYGQTALFYAIREGHIDVVEYLISQGADVNKMDKKKMTPYAFAHKYNKVKIADLLVNSGAITQTKQSVEKKGKTKKNKSFEEESKGTEDIQKPKKFTLIRILENGDKIALTSQELDTFKSEYPEIVECLFNPQALEELEKEAPEE